MTIKNILDLEHFLAEQLGRVAEGDMTPAAANASSNLAGKLLSSVKMRMDHDRMCGKKPEVPFLLLTAAQKKALKLEHKDANFNTITGEVETHIN
jgi:hypothetical protein